MQGNTSSGMELLLYPAEESVLNEQWLAWLKKLSIECVTKAHLRRKKGRKYDAEDYWMVLIHHVFLNLSLNEASDYLNQVLWDQASKSTRRKIHPKKYKGQYQRKERKCPNGNQTRTYRNTLPEWLVKNLNEYIFERQIEHALRERLITREVDIIVDNMNQWYYGRDRYPDNPFITKGTKGPGTSRKRNYLGIMLKSGKTSLYCGVAMIKKGASNVPFILEFLDRLLRKGFTIRYLIGDRGFPARELLDEVLRRGIDFIGPYKKYASIRRAIEAYIKKGGNYIVPYTIHGAPARYYGQLGLSVWLILTNRQGRRLSEIRADYSSGAKTLQECVKEIMVMMTTVVPPRGRKTRQGWAVQICRLYDHRWQIETGFRDLNRISPPSNARTNMRKFFMTSLRYWVYNAWQLERAKRAKLRTCPRSWRNGPTLRRFTYCAIQREMRC